MLVTESEIWADVIGFEGRYRVSNFGRVWSTRKQRAITLKNQGRYYGVSLFNEDGETRFYVHILVLRNFKGPRPFGLQCRHLDGDPRNNNISNLAWGTARENQKDRTLHGTGQLGKRRGPVRKTRELCREVLERYRK